MPPTEMPMMAPVERLEEEEEEEDGGELGGAALTEQKDIDENIKDCI